MYRGTVLPPSHAGSIRPVPSPYSRLGTARTCSSASVPRLRPIRVLERPSLLPRFSGIWAAWIWRPVGWGKPRRGGGGGWGRKVGDVLRVRSVAFVVVGKTYNRASFHGGGCAPTASHRRRHPAGDARRAANDLAPRRRRRSRHHHWHAAAAGRSAGASPPIAPCLAAPHPPLACTTMPLPTAPRDSQAWPPPPPPLPPAAPPACLTLRHPAWCTRCARPPRGGTEAAAAATAVAAEVVTVAATAAAVVTAVAVTVTKPFLLPLRRYRFAF